MTYFLLFSSVIVGVLLVLLTNPKSSYVRLLLAFSGSYLLSITVLHILPEIYLTNNHHTHSHSHEINSKLIGILILAGVLTQSILESFSKGAEHGHICSHNDAKKFPFMLFLSLCIHAFSEGIPILEHNDNLLWAIVVHKIPISIVLTTFLLQSKISKILIFSFLITFASMSPLGYFSANKILIFSEYHTEISAFIVGIFLHISTVILFESNEKHKFKLRKFIAILLGILLAVFSF